MHLLAQAHGQSPIGDRGEAVLHALALAVVLCDAQSQVLFMNHAAERALAGVLPLRIHEGRLWSADARLLAEVQAAVGRCAEAADPERSRCLKLPHAGGRRSLLSLTRVQWAADDDAVGATLVTIQHASARPSLDPFHLQQAYNLTPAEARVAAAVAEGKAPKLVAQEFGVTLHTVRSQLRCVYAKVGVRNSNELIAALHWEHCHTFW